MMFRYRTFLMWFLLLGGAFLPQQISHSEVIASDEGMVECWSVDGEQPAAELGYAVSAGDVNGDGYGDVFVGTPKYGDEIIRSGAVFGFYGGPSGLRTTPDWVVSGPQAGARFGSALSSAGDVNGDGFVDVIVGAFRYNGGQAEEGAVFGFYGGSEGLGNAPDWMVEGNQVEGLFGIAVAAGDVDGDGFSDVIIGARGQNSLAGTVYVYLGSEAGLNTSYAWVVNGYQSGASLGGAVATGDVNGDGFADVIAGAPFYDESEAVADVGAVWVYLGAENGLPDFAHWFVMGTQVNARLGVAVSSAGDVNGDGFDEVIVGASGQDGEVADEGTAFVYMGSAVGLPGNPAWMGVSGQSGAGYGNAVSGAGDLNGDGFDDILVGAYTFEEDQPAEGGVFIYLGAGGGLSEYGRLVGNKADTWFGFSIGMTGDVNGDGWDEMIVGAPEYRVNHDLVGRAYVYELQLSETYSIFLPAIWSGQP